MSRTNNINLILQEAFDQVPGFSFQQKLDHLSNCNCCERHQINKPIIFSAWNETPFNYDQSIHPCMCNCRHISRMICRQVIGRPPSPVSIIDN